MTISSLAHIRGRPTFGAELPGLKVADRAGSGSRPIADPQILLDGMNRVVLAAHSPPGTAVLKEADLAAIRSLKISLDDVIDMDVAVNKNGLPPEDAAHSWLETHGAH